MKRLFQTCSLSLALSTCALAAERAIDVAASKLTIHVGKSGFFSAAGHEHEVSAPIAEGALDDSNAGRVWFRLDAAKLSVLPEKDRDAVQRTMQQQVLESDKFPEIRFESTAVKADGAGKWLVTGNLSLHGQKKPITVEAQRQVNAYIGQARVKQTEFGITPVSAAGGTVKVKDELKIDFLIVAKN